MARVVCLREWLKWVERERMRVTTTWRPSRWSDDTVRPTEYDEVAETPEERAAM